MIYEEEDDDKIGQSDRRLPPKTPFECMNVGVVKKNHDDGSYYVHCRIAINHAHHYR